MHPTLISAAALFGLSTAVPLVSRQQQQQGVQYSQKPSNKPFQLTDGFPNPNPDQLKDIARRAGGTLPMPSKDAPAPPNPGPDGITNLQFIAFNEIFEVAFFTDLLVNITENKPGYTQMPNGIDRNKLIQELIAVQAQEEQHALNANNALKQFGAQPIQPCAYQFPVNNLQDAIALASNATELVLGTLQDVIEIFAKNNGSAFTRGVASALGNEAEQEGFYRYFLSQKPSSGPFLTTSVRDFAFTAINSFVVKDSCPNLNDIKLNTFQPLNLLSQNIQPGNQNLKFQFDLADLVNVTNVNNQNNLPFSLVYINAQNAPVVQNLQNVQRDGTKVTFEAFFPEADNLMTGLNIAAVVKNNLPLATVSDVDKATLFGPALISVE